jgi:5-methylcytosine-specific restriction endonuclease McrA
MCLQHTRSPNHSSGCDAQMATEIISRAEAQTRGLKRYFTGNPCKHGHLCGRMVSDTKCSECLRLKTRRFHKNWRDRNKDKIREYHSKYLAKKGAKERRRETQRIRQANNREAINAYARQYRIKNPEKVREKQRLWCAANRDKRKALWQNRRVRTSNATGSFSARDIRDLMKEQRGKCAYFKICGTSIKNEYHIDHIVALINGGTNFRSNLQLLCPRCNLMKGSKDPIEFSQMHGLLI